jgi:putative redox protein
MRPLLKTYALHGTTARSSCRVGTGTGHTILTDLPKAMGGSDQAAQPVELLLAALLGCKSATAHYVAQHLWRRPHNRIEQIEWIDVVAHRDDRGATSLPITSSPPVGAGLIRVSGVASVQPRGPVSHEDVQALGALVEARCPVAVMFAAAGCEMNFEWRLREG